ncbi:hypothetical protein EBS02_02935 [bacterium]|nr:hypothetical protein [bacterium]
MKPQDKDPNSYITLQDELYDFLNEKEKELIEKGLYPETKPLNFDMDLEDKAELNNQNKSQFFAKYFKSMN